MENNIEYWKNKIQKESGIPPHFFEIINNQELYTNKQKAKIKKLSKHIKHKLTVKQNIEIEQKRIYVLDVFSTHRNPRKFRF